MKNNLAKRMIAIAVLTSWLTTPSLSMATNYSGLNAPNGAAINNSTGSKTVIVDDNSTFYNNTATNNYYGGGAIYNSNQGLITIGDNVQFDNNSLTGINTPMDGTVGGAIASWGGSSIKIGDSVSFTNNGYTDTSMSTIGAASGGAIYMSGGGNGVDPQGSLIIGNDALFEANVTTGAGAGIYNEGSALVIGNGANFTNNYSQSSSGAIYNYQYNSIPSTVTIGDYATFDKNTAVNDSGGAISNFFGDLEIGTNAIFKNNTAGYAGGAIRNTGTAIIGHGSQFLNNIAKADDNGGGAISNSGTMTLNGTSIFTSNSALNGGAINNTGTITVGGEFKSNHADNWGGAIFSKGTVNINANSIFENNTADVVGGAVVASLGATQLNIGEGVLFKNNSAVCDGGALGNYNSAVIANNVIFQENKAQLNASDSNAIGGGAISLGAESTTQINNSQFIANTSGFDGGAIATRHSLSANNLGAGYTIVGSTFSQNKALGTTTSNAYGTMLTGGNGGAISNHFYAAADGSAGVSISSSIFNNNFANANGGAIYNGGYADKADNYANMVITGAQFTTNTANQNGGAIYNAANMAVGGSFDSNNAILGGAIYNTNSLTVTGNSTFKNNIADNGGAIYNTSSSANLTLDTTDGDIAFENNSVNDIYLNDNAQMNLKGSNNVSIKTGIAGALGTIINNASNLILGIGSDNRNFLGTFNQTAGTTEVHSTFFGGENNIAGGSLILKEGASIGDGTTINLSGTGNLSASNFTLNENNSISMSDNATVDFSDNIVLTGDVIGVSGNQINLADGNLQITGDKSSYEGAFTQSGADSVTEITNGTFFAGINEIQDGKLIIKQDATIASDINMDTDTTLNLDGRTIILSGNQINLDGFNIIGAGVLEDTDISVDSSTGITGDVFITEGTTLTPTDGDNIDISGATISLAEGVVTNQEQTMTLDNTATIKLTPSTDGTLVLDSDIISQNDGDGAIVVEGSNIGGTDYAAGNIIINSDNSGFTGDYTQTEGTVTVTDGATFFGGTNTIAGGIDGTGAYNSGKLILNSGANLASDIDVVGDDTTDVFDLASIVLGNEIGSVNQETISTGQFDYGSGLNINVQNATAYLANGTVINENELTLQTDTSGSNQGVRLLGLSNGSGVTGNINLKDNTGLVYGDGAYVQDDTKLSMTNADLVFANSSSDINYNPEITGSGNISKTGNGTTNLSSTLNKEINLNVNGGQLNLNNKSTTDLGSISVSANNNSKAIINIAANRVNLNGKTISVKGENAQAHFKGEVHNANVNVDKGTIGLYGNSSLNDFTLGSTLTTMDGQNINTLNVAGTFTLNDNSNYYFDANPRTGIMDNIVVGDFNNPADSKLIISGIAFTETPIDENVTFDISNILTATTATPTSSTDGVVQLQDGGLLTNTQMGRYLISSSGSSNILNASLLSVNPQMYRGQVATVASYANQLAVNNMLFDHMNILANDLMDRDKNANRYAAVNPIFAPYQYSKKDGNLWYKAYGNLEKISMTQGFRVGNNAYGSIIGADFPLVDLKNGWKLVPTAYIAYNGGHQHFHGVSMYQNGAQLGAMGTAYKGNLISSLLGYAGGYGNDMSVRNSMGGASDTTGNWFAGVASKTAYNVHLPHNLILQPSALVSYNIFGNQNYHSNFGNMSMNSGLLNGINLAPGLNLIWNKETFSLYATAQVVFNIMGNVSGQAGNVNLEDVRMKTTYLEYGIGAMKKFKDTFSGYLQLTLRNGYRTGIGFQGGLNWKVGKDPNK